MLPEQDAVVILTAEISNMQTEIDLVWDHLVPAMKAAPLADSGADEKLRARLAALALPVPTGVAVSMAKKTVRFEKNALGIESATIHVEAETTIILKTRMEQSPYSEVAATQQIPIAPRWTRWVTSTSVPRCFQWVAKDFRALGLRVRGTRQTMPS